MATSGLGTARWKVMSPLLPESGSVALTVRMTLPAGVCSGSSTWKRRKPVSIWFPLPRAPSSAGMGGWGWPGSHSQGRPPSHRQGVCGPRPFKCSWGSPAPCLSSRAAAHAAQASLQQGPAQVSPQTICLGCGPLPIPSGLPTVLIHFSWTLCIQLCPLQGLVPGSPAWFLLLPCHSDSRRDVRM